MANESPLSFSSSLPRAAGEGHQAVGRTATGDPGLGVLGNGLGDSAAEGRGGDR